MAALLTTAEVMSNESKDEVLALQADFIAASWKISSSTAAELTLAAAISGRSVSEVVRIYEQVSDQVGDAEAAGMLTVAAARSGRLTDADRAAYDALRKQSGLVSQNAAVLVAGRALSR